MKPYDSSLIHPNKFIKFLILGSVCSLFPLISKCQDPKFDSTNNPRNLETIKKYDPHKATLRSLILPGWGQAYNKEYWKLPIVAAGISIPTIAFFQNKNWHKEANNAYNIAFKAVTTTGSVDLTMMQSLPKDYLNEYNKNVLKYGASSARNSILALAQSQRNYYRRNQDYAGLWLLIMWGLNVADATVFGHLKNFDIGPNLSFKPLPNIYKTNNETNVTMLFKWNYNKKNFGRNFSSQ